MTAEEIIKKYCAYQERSHAEVRTRLVALGLDEEEIEALLADLIAEDFVNEERFARAAVRGKFRIKSWGRRKILNWLRAKKVSEYCINKGMEEIEEQDYVQTMERLMDKKWEQLSKEKALTRRKAKLYGYMVQKGYEPDLILPALAKKGSL